VRIFFSVNHSGCAYWRCRVPAKVIEKLGLAEVVVFSQEDTTREDLEDIMSWANVIVGQSAAGALSVALIMKYKELGKITVMDYDDLVYSCSPFNPAYRTLGISNVTIKDDKGNESFMWQDGVNGFSLKENLVRYRSQQDILRLTDLITTTNKHLAERYGKDIPEQKDKIFVLPNSIDFDTFKPFPKRENKKIRIGWTPSASHYAEAFMVRDIFERILKKYGDKVEFVILGDLIELKDYFKDKLEYHQFIDLSIYPLKLASLNLDIAICPLEDNEFNRYKSQLKWSEFAAMKIPCVVSDSLPYEDVIEGSTGLKAKNVDEWEEKLSILIDSPSLRSHVSDNAYDFNRQHYDIEKNARLWVKAYEGQR